jgi:ATP-dependent helicase/nuclease subunit B
MDALDTLVDAAGDADADAPAFASLLRQVLAEADVGSIPSGIDEVVVGSADQIRLGEVEHVLLLGCTDAEFPGSPAEDGLFSDTDKVLLEGEGIVLSPRTDLRMQEELFWFYRAACLPRRSLTLFIPRTDGRAGCAPSLGAERIFTLFPALAPQDAAAWEAGRFIFTPDDAARKEKLLRGTPAGEALARLGAFPPPPERPISFSARAETISEEAARLLFPGDVSLTQSRIDAFVRCRFGYYCRYAARLEEEKEASLTALHVGTFLHRVFELFFTHVREERLTLPLEKEALLALTEEIAARAVREIAPEDPASGRTEYLFRRLKRCVLPMLASLSRELGEGAFRPSFFELPVGRDGPLSVPARRIPFADGRAVLLGGTIDRLDTWRNGTDTYVRVVDYKTGAKKFSPDDIAVGLNTQLLLYLFTVLRCPPGAFRRALTGDENGSVRAAGAVYVSARPGESVSDVLLGADEALSCAEEDTERSGILLDDDEVRRAMAPEHPEYLPPTAVSAEEMERMEDALCGTAARIADELTGGGAEAVPRLDRDRGVCDRCAYRTVCRSADARYAD